MSQLALGELGIVLTQLFHVFSIYPIAIATYTLPFGCRVAEGLHMQDLESGLYYSLWVEMPSRTSFEGESLAALKEYIEVLHKVS